MSVSHVAECPDLGPECEGPVEPTPFNHHIDQVIAETALTVSLGITPYFGLDTRWSLRVADVNPTYSELDGTPKDLPNDIHHHDETLVDITDPWLLGRVGAVMGPLTSVARLGLTFPVGRTEPDPYELGRRGESHQHLQAGTGTFVPVVGFGLAYAIEPVTIGLGGIGLFNAYENSEGFRAPVRLYANHRVSVALFDGVLTPNVEAAIAHEGEEYWNGAPGEEGSNVRTEVYLGGGLALRFYEQWIVEGAARARVATLTDAPSFETGGLFSLALSTSFELWADEPDAAEGSGESPAVTPIRERREDGVVEFTK